MLVLDRDGLGRDGFGQDGLVQDGLGRNGFGRDRTQQSTICLTTVRGRVVDADVQDVDDAKTPLSSRRSATATGGGGGGRTNHRVRRAKSVDESSSSSSNNNVVVPGSRENKIRNNTIIAPLDVEGGGDDDGIDIGRHERRGRVRGRAARCGGRGGKVLRRERGHGTGDCRRRRRSGGGDREKWG